MRVLVRIAIALLLLVILAVGGVVVFIDPIVRGTIERAGSSALGVETTVDAADVGLGSTTSCVIEGIRIANPPGFASPHFFTMSRSSLEFSLGSLFSDTIRAPELSLTGIDLHLERSSAGTNYGVILDNLKRMEAPDGDAERPGEEDSGGGKRFVLERIALRNVHATIDLLPEAGDAARFSITIPEIVLEDVGSDGMTAAQIYDLVIKTLLAATVESGAGVIPDDVLQDLGARLEDLEQISYELTRKAEVKVQELTQELEGKLDETLEKAKKSLKKELDGLFKKK
ncbi:MAG: hypothetical protein O7B99_14305 [Planctomycetota bacterium]|nr:hypothetical protein [Planctomycetota bacterium]